MPEGARRALAPGALTDSMVVPLLRSGVLRGGRLVVKDPSRVLLTPDTLDKLRARQVRLETAEAARTLCVTINPVSAYGWKFDKDEFIAPDEGGRGRTGHQCKGGAGMIQIRFEEREKIGLQYILESLHGCSPFGQERIRRLRYYTPDEREELEQELRNVERAAAHAGELKDLYDQICVVLCQMKDIRGSLRRCRELEVPDHVELFELKGYLQRLETLRPLFEKLRDTAA